MKSAEWDIEISPEHSSWRINLRDLWQHRDLMSVLVKRDFISFYKQTVLGPLWFFIQPLFTTLIYTFVFGNLASLSTDGLPQPLFYMAGITAWNYFAECLTKTSTVFKDNAAIFGKVYFPRLIMPLSIVVSNLARFGVQIILFLLTMGWYYFSKGNVYFHLSVFIFLFPVNVLFMAMLGLGLGLIVSALTTRYRDLAFLVSFGVQLLMYATTVIYPLSTALEKFPKYSWIITVNPMTAIIETFRKGFLGAGTVSLESYLYSMSSTVIILFIGIVIFNKAEKDFVDTV